MNCVIRSPLHLGDVNLAPEGRSSSQKVLQPDPQRAWKPLANIGFKPMNFCTTNLELLVSDFTGAKVYDNFVVRDVMARRVVEGSPRVIRSDEEAFATWLRSRGEPEFGTPQWTHATDRTRRQLLSDFKSEFLRAKYDEISQAADQQTSGDGKCEPAKWFSYGLGHSDHRCLLIELDVGAMPPPPRPPLSSSSSSTATITTTAAHDESRRLFQNALVELITHRREEETLEEEKNGFPTRCLAQYKSGVRAGSQCDNRTKYKERFCGLHAKCGGREHPCAVWRFEHTATPTRRVEQQHTPTRPSTSAAGSSSRGNGFMGAGASGQGSGTKTAPVNMEKASSETTATIMPLKRVNGNLGGPGISYDWAALTVNNDKYIPLPLVMNAKQGQSVNTCHLAVPRTYYTFLVAPLLAAGVEEQYVKPFMESDDYVVVFVKHAKWLTGTNHTPDPSYGVRVASNGSVITAAECRASAMVRANSIKAGDAIHPVVSTTVKATWTCRQEGTKRVDTFADTNAPGFSWSLKLTVWDALFIDRYVACPAFRDGAAAPPKLPRATPSATRWCSS